MRWSQSFFPTLKETPSEATIPSHQLMLRAGLISACSSGIYNWLPMGLRVLQKIQNIIREAYATWGCLETLMPLIQDAALWEESGRSAASYGPEMLRLQDRHERPMLFGPTAEEHVTDLFRQFVKSYRQLPLVLYQMQWKFRDEIRPRFGVMRGREFLLKDAYSFDLSPEGLQKTYKATYKLYQRIFRTMGLKAIPVKADSGAIGGEFSHEFHVLAQTGESCLYYDQRMMELPQNEDIEMDAFYAASEEKHDPAACQGLNIQTSRGIEVGHIFDFGTKYSVPMKACVTHPDGSVKPVYMGSYGIGISRLVGAAIESHHDERGIRWPRPLAPFSVVLITIPNTKDHDALMAAGNDLYASLQSAGIEVLYDDRDERGGQKFAEADLIGFPFQIVIGIKGLSQRTVEIKDRNTQECLSVSFDRVVEVLKEKISFS